MARAIAQRLREHLEANHVAPCLEEITHG
jgi:hypothetical protein